MRTVAAVFPNLTAAEQAYRDLEHIGVPRESISLLAGDAAHRREYLEKARKASTSTEAAAASTAGIGGGVGILATLAALAIPGVGPLYAIGPLMTVLAGAGVGATFGGLIGAFHNMGISHEEAPFLEEAAKRGEIIVVAPVDNHFEEEAVAVLKRNGARDVRDSADSWAATDWSGPAKDPHPYVYDSARKDIKD